MISKKIGGSDQISLIRCEKFRGCFLSFYDYHFMTKVAPHFQCVRIAFGYRVDSVWIACAVKGEKLYLCRAIIKHEHDET